MITNYSDLQSTIATWLARADLTGQIPTFIQLAEKQIGRQLRFKNQETTVTGTAAATIALPADYVEMISLTLASGGEERPLMQKDRFSATALNNSSSNAYYYTIEGGDIVITPSPSGSETYTLQYYASIAALSDSAPTNWLITNHPDLYLYASLLHSAPFLQDDARAQVWQAMYEQARAAAQEQNDKDRWSGSPISARAGMSCW